MLLRGLCSSGGTPSRSPGWPGWTRWPGAWSGRSSPPPLSPARARAPQGRCPLQAGISGLVGQLYQPIRGENDLNNSDWSPTPRKSLRSSKEANGAGPDLGCRDLYEVSVMTRLTYCLNTAGCNTYFGRSPLYSPLLDAGSNSSSSFIIFSPHGSWLHCS